MEIKIDKVVVPGLEEVFTLALINERGLAIRLTNYGAIVLGIDAPDGKGGVDNLVLGYDRVGDYMADPYYMGGVIGRATNRIGGGRLDIGGRVYQLTKNEAPGNHLHGGTHGFHKKLWRVADFSSDALQASVLLSLTSPHLEEGYPGNVEAFVKYTLTADDQWTVQYRATSDEPTVVNMTQHSYFNLSGEDSVLEHAISVFSDEYSPSDKQDIATGASLPVDQTFLDLRSGRRVGDTVGHIDTVNYCFPGDGVLRRVAKLSHAVRRRSLEISSTSPGLQVYTGRNLRGRFAQYGAICLEPQYYPYLPNGPVKEDWVLRPGRTYEETSVYHFTTV